ncbi:hypothetical protein YC2023_018377 [Brassica napus]
MFEVWGLGFGTHHFAPQIKHNPKPIYLSNQKDLNKKEEKKDARKHVVGDKARLTLTILLWLAVDRDLGTLRLKSLTRVTSPTVRSIDFYFQHGIRPRECA